MANLTVTHTEDITLNGQQFGGTNVFSITGINNILKRIITVAANNDTTIASFHSDQHDDDATLDVENIRYVRITNLDPTNWMVLFFTDGANAQAFFKVEAGKSFILSTPVGFDTESAEDDSDDIDEFTSTTITSIQAKANSAIVKAEIFVATA